MIQYRLMYALSNWDSHFLSSYSIQHFVKIFRNSPIVIILLKLSKHKENSEQTNLCVLLIYWHVYNTEVCCKFFNCYNFIKTVGTKELNLCLILIYLHVYNTEVWISYTINLSS